MKSISLSIVIYEMLTAIAKKQRKKPAEVIEKFIKDTYYTL